MKIGKRLEEFDIYWFEEPLPPDDLNGMREVKERVRVSLAAGERLYNRYEYRQFFDLNCADYIQPDISARGRHFRNAVARSGGGQTACLENHFSESADGKNRH